MRFYKRQVDTPKQWMYIHDEIVKCYLFQTVHRQNIRHGTHISSKLPISLHYKKSLFNSDEMKISYVFFFFIFCHVRWADESFNHLIKRLQCQTQTQVAANWVNIIIKWIHRNLLPSEPISIIDLFFSSYNKPGSIAIDWYSRIAIGADRSRATWW